MAEFIFWSLVFIIILFFSRFLLCLLKDNSKVDLGFITILLFLLSIQVFFVLSPSYKTQEKQVYTNIEYQLSNSFSSMKVYQDGVEVKYLVVTNKDTKESTVYSPFSYTIKNGEQTKLEVIKEKTIVVTPNWYSIAFKEREITDSSDTKVVLYINK